ncbi:MAG: retropepsin-like aspartic protease [Elusimicrobiota bacterium]
MVLVVLSLAIGLSARADVIHLKNGNRMEGVITSRTDSQVTLDFGYGSTVIETADIARIQKADKKQALQTAEKLKRRQYESGLAIPRGAERLNDLYSRAQAQREQALESRALSRDLDEEAEQIQDSLPAVKSNYASLTSDLSRSDPRSNPAGYNRLVSEVNKAATGVQSANLRLEEIERLKKEAEKRVHHYLESYRRLQEYAAGAGKELLTRESDYYAWLREELATMEGDFRRDNIPAQKTDTGVYVNVVLNGDKTVKLLVDTGASMTVLYREAVAGLRLPAKARLGPAQSKVADGRIVTVEVMRLDSMAVGKSRVSNVLVAAAPTSGQGFDGLLGMTFLSRFVVRIDGAQGRLILEDLK